jgi:hypothetical protein
VGEPAFLTVQIMSGERVMHSQMVTDIGHAALVADDLRKAFVKDQKTCGD